MCKELAFKQNVYNTLIIFGPKRAKIAVEWRKLHNMELNDMYCSPNIAREIKLRGMRRAGYVARMGERRGVYRVLVGKPEGMRPLGRPRHRWEDNIKMDLQEVGTQQSLYIAATRFGLSAAVQLHCGAHQTDRQTDRHCSTRPVMYKCQTDYVV